MIDEQRPTPQGAPDPNEPPAGGRLLLGWICVGLGAVLMIGGWFGVSGEPDVARQLSYLVSGGLGGMLAGIIGVGLLVSADVRRDRERLGRVEAAMLELRDLVAAQAEVSRAVQTAEGNGSEPVGRASPKRAR